MTVWRTKVIAYVMNYRGRLGHQWTGTLANKGGNIIITTRVIVSFGFCPVFQPAI